MSVGELLDTAYDYQSEGRKYNPDLTEGDDGYADSMAAKENAIPDTGDPSIENLLESHLEKDEHQFINTTDAVMNRIRKLKERDFIWDMLSYKVPEEHWDEETEWYDTTEIPMLDLKEILNSNDVLLIDTGELRSERSEIFTVLFLLLY